MLLAFVSLAAICCGKAFAQSTGGLNVTVKNQNGTNISGATVVRYTSSWGYIDQKTTNSSGVASWTGLSPATYNLEAYYNGEYWVNSSATVTAGSTTPKTLQRNEPYAYDFRVYNGNTDVTGQNVIVGTPLTYRVYVRNSSPVTRSVRVNLCVDRTNVGGSDFCPGFSASHNISSNGGTYTFTFNHTPTATGTYSRQIEVQTSVNGNWAKTDSWPWGTAYTGVCNESADITGFTVPTGVIQRGQSTEVRVSIKNIGTCTRSFWVGLSFWGPMSEAWPDGWLDVIPQQTAVLAPGIQETVTYEFVIPGWLPAGQYGAITKVWPGYDPVAHLMTPPFFDEWEIPTSFQLQGPAQVNDLVGETVFPATDIDDLSLPYQFTHGFELGHRTDPGPYNGALVKVSKLPPIAGGQSRVSIVISKNSSNSAADKIYGRSHSQLLVVLPNSVQLHDGGNGIQTRIDGDVRTWQEYTDVGIRTVFHFAPIGEWLGINEVGKEAIKKLASFVALLGFYRGTDAVDIDVPVEITNLEDNVLLAIDFSDEKWGSSIETFSEFELRFDLSYSGTPKPITIIPDVRYKRLLGIGGAVNVEGFVQSPGSWLTWQTTIERIDDLPNLEFRKQFNIYPSALLSNVSVTVQTVPAGRTIMVDDVSYSSPWTFDWLSGESHSIGTTSPQSDGAGSRFLWSNWSDGGAISHSVAPSTPTTYTANFTTQYYLTMQKAPDAGGTITPSSGWYNAGAPVQIEAYPAENYEFTSWTGLGGGSYTGSDNPANVTINGPISQTANFAQKPISVTIQTSPSGQSFSVDGTPYTTTQTFSWTPESNHTIATTSPQSGGAGTQYVWSNWSDGGAISHPVSPSVSTTYTASFTTQYYLTTQASPGGGGTVTPSSGWRNSGAGVQVEAMPNGGYDFASWTGSGSGSYTGSNNPTGLTMNGPITETANFELQPIEVTVRASPSGRSFTVDGTSYTTTQTFSWTPGSNHTIATTSPQSGETGTQYAWSSWSDGGAISHPVAPTTPTTYTANFTTQHYLTMAKAPDAGGTVTPSSGWHNVGTPVQIEADPAAEYEFTSWTGVGSGSYTGSNNPASVTMNGPITETANFELHPIEVTVETSPSGHSITVDGSAYTSPETFLWEPGSNHTIATTSPQNGGTGTQYVWSNWSDGAPITHTVAPTTATTYTANFTTQHYLTTQASPEAGGTATPSSGWYDSGTGVQVEAAANAGYGFVGWSGSCDSGIDNPQTITINAPCELTANFECPTQSSPSPGTLDPPDRTTGQSTRLFSWALVPTATSYRLQITINTTPECVFDGPLWKDTVVSTPSALISDIPGLVCWRVMAIGPCSNSPYTSPVLYTDVREVDTDIIPDSYSLSQNYPNPFNASTQIRFSVPTDTRVTLVVYDVLGRRIATLTDSEIPHGVWSASWNGLDDQGRPVSSGLYLCRMSTDQFDETIKMILMK